MEEVTKHGSHNQSSHGRGKGGAGATGIGGGGSSKLSPDQDKQMNSLAIEMFNHKQSVPLSMKLGRMSSPSAQAHIKAGQDIVSRATAILGGSRAGAMAELNARMGL